MLTNKTIIHIFVMCFFVCQTLQTCSYEGFTRRQFLGVWYTIATTKSPHVEPPGISCYQMNITKEAGRYQNFREVITFYINGAPKKIDSYGRIITSTVYLLFPYFENGVSFGVTRQNNQQELLINDRDHPKSYALLSRTPTVSAEAKEQFKMLAQAHGMDGYFINHENCRYGNDSTAAH